MFAHIIGNEKIKTYLTRMEKNNAIGNSLLFAGPAGVGKSLFAEAFARLVLTSHDPAGVHLHKLKTGNHPDLHIFRPEGKVGMHSISAMRQLSEEVYLPPYEGARKVFIIHDAERMLPYSANALLKTFEEPSLDSIIILVSSAPQLLLPTIMSRCRAVYFQMLSDDEVAQILVTASSLSEEEAKNIAALSGGSAEKAFSLIRGEQCSLRGAVMELLIQGKFKYYKQLADQAKRIADIILERAAQAETDAKQEWLKDSKEKLTALQRQSLEKELEGLSSMKTAREAQALFEMILSWYRDLHLLTGAGDLRFLLNKDILESLEKTLQRGSILGIEFVQKAIQEAKLALERSTPLSLCLESLFLRLDML